MTLPSGFNTDLSKANSASPEKLIFCGIGFCATLATGAAGLAAATTIGAAAGGAQGVLIACRGEDSGDFTGG